MPVGIDNKDRRFEMVTSIEVAIGQERVQHNFGRRVAMSHARAWAQHFLNVFTGEASHFVAGANGELRHGDRFEQAQSFLIGQRWTTAEAEELILLIRQGEACLPPSRPTR